MGSPPLLPAVAAGDEAAFQACIDRYGPLIWAVARRFLGRCPDAEEAVQDAFVDIWRSAGRFDASRGSEVVFLLTIARRRILDRRRRIARRPDFAPLDSIPESAGDDAPPLSEEAERASRFLAALPQDQRLILELSVRDGLSHAEIASRLTLPLGTVKAALRRGLLRLRAALRPA